MENIYQPSKDSNVGCQIPGLEWIYAGIFGIRRQGTFVEIGAHDGVSWSNTSFLAELGWAGLYVEPIEHLYNKCVVNHRHHPLVNVAKYAVGAGDTITMRQNGDTDYLFTGNPEFAKLNSATKITGEFQTIKLDTLLLNYHIQPGFDLLVIDVEGMEVEVLKGFTLGAWLPTLVIIETHELNPNAEMAERTGYINTYFLEKYKKIYTSAINTLYLIK